jgi:hypothetical protein
VGDVEECVVLEADLVAGIGRVIELDGDPLVR